MSNNTIICTVLQCDELSKYSGVTYPRGEMEKAIEHYKDTRISNNTAFGTFGNDPTYPVDVSKTSHNITDLTINEQGQIIAHIDFLDTEMGRIAYTLMDGEMASAVLSCGCTVTDDKTVKDVNIDQFFIVNNVHL